MILSRDFFMDDSIDMAKKLLGTYLCRRMPDGMIIRAKICDVELYHESERGCHAYAGRQTKANEAMFLDGGHIYVYLCYGMYNMLNVVVGKSGVAAAVFIRALEYDECNGPGKLTRKLNISCHDNKLDLCDLASNMWLENRDTIPEIVSLRRIGIDFAGSDSDLLWRFVINDSLHLSRPI
ncbi:MAG: DNA-3-methyladenine glycosylase [Alphaproteobacteria bacterium]|nr:DNA-3-methyladenine glycosylase [Alphaproteobacteria bacterium]